MLTQARIDTLLRPAGLDWVSSLRAPQIAELARDQGPFPLSFFDERNLLEVVREAFPGERPMVCRNPLPAEERARQREVLLAATEERLQKIVDATQRPHRPLRGADAIGLRVGPVCRMAKHFTL